MRLIKNLIALIIVVNILVCNLFVHATTDDVLFTFFDDFSVHNTNAMNYTGNNTQLDSNWRTLSNSAGTMGKNNDIVAGFNNQKLCIATNTGAADFEFKSSTITYLPTVIYSGDNKHLTANQEIKVTAQKSHDSDMWGVKFYQHNNDKNYYALFFGGMYTYASGSSGYATWQLFKVVDNVPVLLEQKIRTNSSSDDIEGYMGTGIASLTVNVNGSLISWELDYKYNAKNYKYSSSFEDEKPFNVSTGNTTLGLFTAGSTNATRKVSFDDISILGKKNVESGLFKYTENFDGFSDKLIYGSEKLLSDNWRTKYSFEGKMGYNDDAIVGYKGKKLFVQSRGLMDGDNEAQYSKWASTVPALVWQANNDEITDNQIIKMKISKEHGSETAGVRFLVHNGGQNYYALIFPGMYGYGGIDDTDATKESWQLVKSVDGVLTQVDCLKRVLPSDINGDTVDTFLRKGLADVTISYIDGKITWNADVSLNGNEIFSWEGYYVDSSPFNIKGKDTTIWLMSGLYSGTDTTRGVYFDDIEISAYDVYLNNNEPNEVLYKDEIYGLSSTNGEYILKSPTYIRRLVAEGVSGEFKIYASIDGNEWDLLKTFDSDGNWLNNKYSKKYNFVLTNGIGSLKVLGEIDKYGLLLPAMTSVKLYPYINGDEVDITEIVSDTNAVTVSDDTISTNYLVKDANVEVYVGNTKFEFPIHVGYCNVSIDYTNINGEGMIQLTSPWLQNKTTSIMLMYYTQDDKLEKIESHYGIFSNDGVCEIYIEDNNEVGSYIKCLVLNNLVSRVPYTNMETIK